MLGYLFVLSWFSLSINTHDNCVISLVRLERELLLWLQLLRLELFDLGSEDGLGRRRRINATRLYRDHEVTAVFEKVVRIQRYNTSLIGLRYVREYDVDHADQHAVFVGVTRVLDDRYDVCSFLGHVYEIAARSVREFYSIYKSFLWKATKKRGFSPYLWKYSLFFRTNFLFFFWK